VSLVATELTSSWRFETCIISFQKGREAANHANKNPAARQESQLTSSDVSGIRESRAQSHKRHDTSMSVVNTAWPCVDRHYSSHGRLVTMILP
jgi:hypothetical protein